MGKRPTLIAERMNRLMEKLEINQSELGRRLEMPPGSIQAICSGKVKRPTVLKEIAEQLQTSQDYLLGLTDDPQRAPAEEDHLAVYRGLSPSHKRSVAELARSLAESEPKQKRGTSQSE